MLLKEKSCIIFGKCAQKCSSFRATSGIGWRYDYYYYDIHDKEGRGDTGQSVHHYYYFQAGAQSDYVGPSDWQDTTVMQVLTFCWGWDGLSRTKIGLIKYASSQLLSA